MKVCIGVLPQQYCRCEVELHCSSCSHALRHCQTPRTNFMLIEEWNRLVIEHIGCNPGVFMVIEMENAST